MPPNPATLAELTDIAMDLARIVHRQIALEGAADEARAAAGQPPQATALIARLLDLYIRIARCIRQIVALHATLGTAALTPAQTAAIDRKKQDLRTLAAEVATQTTPPAPADPKTEAAADAEPPTRPDRPECLTDPPIDQPTAIARLTQLITAVRRTLTPAAPVPPISAPNAANPAPAALPTQIAECQPQPPSPRPTRNPPIPPAPIPDG